MTNQHLLAEVSAKRCWTLTSPGRSFSFPKSTMLAEGMFAEVPDTDAENQLDSLPERVRQTLLEAKQAGIKHPIAVSAIPLTAEKLPGFLYRRMSIRHRFRLRNLPQKSRNPIHMTSVPFRSLRAL